MIDILVLGSNSDSIVRDVSKKIRNAGIKIVVLDNKKHFNIIIRITPKDGFEFLINEENVRIPKIVWSRIKIFPPRSINNEQMRRRYVSDNEWIALYNDIEIIFQNRVINSLISKKTISTRLYQLKIAQSIGLNIPDTVISTKKDIILKFSERNTKLATKALSDLVVNELDNKEITHSVITTSSITKEDIECIDHKHFILSPTLFQSYIEKKFEHRVVCIGSLIFSCRVNSQLNKTTEIDWRRNERILTWEISEIPYHVKYSILLFMKTTGLSYGVFDFIETLDKKYIFLECNPNGQWYWLDKIHNGSITTAFANYFIEKIKKNNNSYE